MSTEDGRHALTLLLYGHNHLAMNIFESRDKGDGTLYERGAEPPSAAQDERAKGTGHGRDALAYVSNAGAPWRNEAERAYLGAAPNGADRAFGHSRSGGGGAADAPHAARAFEAQSLHEAARGAAAQTHVPEAVGSWPPQTKGDNGALLDKARHVLAAVLPEALARSVAVELHRALLAERGGAERFGTRVRALCHDLQRNSDLLSRVQSGALAVSVLVRMPAEARQTAQRAAQTAHIIAECTRAADITGTYAEEVAAAHRAAELRRLQVRTVDDAPPVHGGADVVMSAAKEPEEQERVEGPRPAARPPLLSSPPLPPRIAHAESADARTIHLAQVPKRATSQDVQRAVLRALGRDSVRVDVQLYPLKNEQQQWRSGKAVLSERHYAAALLDHRVSVDGVQVVVRPYVDRRRGARHAPPPPPPPSRKPAAEHTVAERTQQHALPLPTPAPLAPPPEVLARSSPTRAAVPMAVAADVAAWDVGWTAVPLPTPVPASAARPADPRQRASAVPAAAPAVFTPAGHCGANACFAPALVPAALPPAVAAFTTVALARTGRRHCYANVVPCDAAPAFAACQPLPAELDCVARAPIDMLLSQLRAAGVSAPPRVFQLLPADAARDTAPLQAFAAYLTEKNRAGVINESALGGGRMFLVPASATRVTQQLHCTPPQYLLAVLLPPV